MEQSLSLAHVGSCAIHTRYSMVDSVTPYLLIRYPPSHRPNVQRISGSLIANSLDWQVLPFTDQNRYVDNYWGTGSLGLLIQASAAKDIAMCAAIRALFWSKARLARTLRPSVRRATSARTKGVTALPVMP